jgi:hypothetical protein
MRSSLPIKIITLLAAGVIAAILLLTLPGHKKTRPNDQPTTALTATVGRVQLRVDPRLELLASVGMNAGFHNIVKYNTPYKRAMRRHFRGQADHEAVRLFRLFSRRGLYVDIPPFYMIHLSDAPALHEVHPLQERTIALFTGDRDSTDRFLKALRDYAVQADINGFFARNQGRFRGMIDQAADILAQRDFVADIEDYYGMEQAGYHMILSPLFEGNYGLRLPAEGGGLELYAVIGGSDFREPNLEGLRYLIWHEFSHSFINPLTDAFEELAAGSEHRFEEIREAMAARGYTSWTTTINEHIIRAVTARLTERVYGPEAAREVLDRELAWGFVHVEDLCRELEVYEQQRVAYPTIRDFYPRLLAVFGR